MGVRQVNSERQDVGGSVDAFERFRKLVADPDHAFTEPPRAYLELLDGFLLNPRFRPHVNLVVKTAFLATVMRSLGKLYPRPLRNRLIVTPLSKQLLEEIDARRAELLDTVLPAEIVIDFTPLRGVETPSAWFDEGMSVLLLEARVAVHPNTGFEPASVLFKLEVSPANDEVHFLASFPETDFSAVGSYNVELASDGRFTQTKTGGAKVGGGIAYGPATATAELSHTTTTETERGESRKVQFEYMARAIKVVSSAVGRTARWQLMRTEDQLPIGGLTFYATLLVPDGLERLECSSEVVVDVEGWGSLKVPRRAVLTVPRRRANGSIGA